MALSDDDKSLIINHPYLRFPPSWPRRVGRVSLLLKHFTRHKSATDATRACTTRVRLQYSGVFLNFLEASFNNPSWPFSVSNLTHKDQNTPASPLQALEKETSSA